MKKINVNVTTLLQVAGLVLGFGSTIVAGIANDKKNKETLAKLVEEALNKK